MDLLVNPFVYPTVFGVRVNPGETMLKKMLLVHGLASLPPSSASSATVPPLMKCSLFGQFGQLGKCPASLGTAWPLMAHLCGWLQELHDARQLAPHSHEAFQSSHALGTTSSIGTVWAS